MPEIADATRESMEQLKKMFQVIWVMTILIVIASCVNTLLLIREFRKTGKQITSAMQSMAGSKEEMGPIEFKMDAFKNDVMNTAGNPKTAKAVMLAFIDNNCGHCREYMREAFPKIREEYIDKGKLIYIAKAFPLSSGTLGSEAAFCAGEQGKYWVMLEKAMGASPKEDELEKISAGIGVNEAQFRECIKKHAYIKNIMDSKSYGSKVGVSGTPTFFIGPFNRDGKTIKAIRMVGYRSYDDFKKQIDSIN